RRKKNQRDYVFGWEIKTVRYIAPSDCLIVSKIGAQNGAIGIIPKSLNNSLITSNFLLFGLRKEYSSLSFDYLVSYLSCANLQDYFRGLAYGTTDRGRLNIKDFLNAR